MTDPIDSGAQAAVNTGLADQAQADANKEAGDLSAQAAKDAATEAADLATQSVKDAAKDAADVAAQKASDAAQEALDRDGDLATIQLDDQEIAQLQAQIAALENPPKFVEKFGFSVSGQSLASFQKFIAMGILPSYIRVYHTPGQMPATWTDSAAKIGDALGVASWISFKPDIAATRAGQNDAWLKGLLSSIPATAKNGLPHIVTMHHEPENKSKNIAGPDFVAFTNYIGKFMRQYAPHVLFIPIWMDYQMHVNKSTWPAYCKGIDPTLIDAIGLDPYPEGVDWKTYTDPDKALATSALGATKPFAYGEIGLRDAKYADKAASFKALFDLEKADALVACYYELDAGGDIFSAAELAELAADLKAGL